MHILVFISNSKEEGIFGRFAELALENTIRIYSINTIVAKPYLESFPTAQYLLDFTSFENLQAFQKKLQEENISVEFSNSF